MNSTECHSVFVLEDSKLGQLKIKQALDDINVVADYYSQITGVDELVRHKYKVAIFDLIIGKQLSTSLIHALKKEVPEMVIIIITSSTELLEQYDYVLGDIDYLFTKPFDIEAVQKIVISSLSDIKHENRKHVRKHVTHIWVAEYNQNLKRHGLF